MPPASVYTVGPGLQLSEPGAAAGNGGMFISRQDLPLPLLSDFLVSPWPEMQGSGGQLSASAL